MSVLFMVGQGIEEEKIVDELLDVEVLKERPNYDYASERGLILDECGFKDI